MFPETQMHSLCIDFGGVLAGGERGVFRFGAFCLWFGCWGFLLLLLGEGLSLDMENKG